MMNKAKLIFLMLATVLLSCEREQVCSFGISSGVISADWVYTNDSLKLKFQLPKDWYISQSNGLSYDRISGENRSYMTEDYIYSPEELEASKKHPILLLDDFFMITKDDPYGEKLTGPVIKFQLTRSPSPNRTAEEDIKIMIEEYDEALLFTPGFSTDINQRLRLLITPQGEAYQYFFLESKNAQRVIGVGIIHKDCYNLKIQIAADSRDQFEEALEVFRTIWMDY